MTFFVTQCGGGPKPRGRRNMKIGDVKKSDPELSEFCHLVAISLGKKLGHITATDVKQAVELDPTFGPRLRAHPKTTGSLAHWKEFRKTDRRVNTGSNDREQPVWEYIGDRTEEKENQMAAKKKKTEEKTEDPRAWHQKIMMLFVEQSGKGEALTGLTFSEARAIMDIKLPSDEGFLEAAKAMVDLRDEHFLAHKFSHPLLAEDFFADDPATDIPNIQKRRNEQAINQVVFFLHPAASALGEDQMPAAVDAGEYPADHEYDVACDIYDRDTVYTWFDELGELIDLYETNDEKKSLSAKMIAALMPAKD